MIVENCSRVKDKVSSKTIKASFPILRLGHEDGNNSFRAFPSHRISNSCGSRHELSILSCKQIRRKKHLQLLNNLYLDGSSRVCARHRVDYCFSRPRCHRAGFIQKFVSQVLLTFAFQANVPGSALCERTAFSVAREEERLKIIKISCRPRSRLSLGSFVCAKSKACPQQAQPTVFWLRCEICMSKQTSVWRVNQIWCDLPGPHFLTVSNAGAELIAVVVKEVFIHPMSALKNGRNNDNYDITMRHDRH